MAQLGPIAFAAPLALWGLLALPLLYFLLRASPPEPKRQEFPAAVLLLGLQNPEETPARTPWPVVALRIAAICAALFGLAQPILSPRARPAAVAGATLIVIDDGWTSAAIWRDIRETALREIDAAGRAGAPIRLFSTASGPAAWSGADALTAQEAGSLMGARAPQPLRPDYANALERLAPLTAELGEILWIGDGLAHAEQRAFAAALATRAPVVLLAPERTQALAITGVAEAGNGFAVTIARAPSPQATRVTLDAQSQDGTIASVEGEFALGQDALDLTLTGPPDLIARTRAIALRGPKSAGARFVLDSSTGRPSVGLIRDGPQAQPLLSGAHYVEKALGPHVSFSTLKLEEAVGARGALVLAEGESLAGPALSALEAWVRGGGVLIRFAGERLAAAPDALLPIRLRDGGRSFGGALGWERPQKIAPFPETSPFFGLDAPKEAEIRRQVLAEPDADLAGKTWAALEDGTPIVTASRLDKGLIVFFHVTASPQWSDLPLDGAFVALLRRAASFAGRAPPEPSAADSVEPWRMVQRMDGYGDLADAEPPIPTIAVEAFDPLKPSVATPPGLYRRAGVEAMINATAPDERFAPTPAALPGVVRLTLGPDRERALSGPLLAAAALLVAIDMIVALAFAGRLPRLAGRLGSPARAAAVLGLLVLSGLGVADSAFAQSRLPSAEAPRRDFDPALEVRLAYIRSGDAQRDSLVSAGLRGLSLELFYRTAIEPGLPEAVDLETADLAFYTLLYWSPRRNAAPLSENAAAQLSRYLRNGGALLIDTQSDSGVGARERPDLARLLAGIEAPPLEPTPADHVLTRSFYLLSEFPGRYRGGALWVEARADGAGAGSFDGVSPLFIGGADWAAAWAIDERGRPMSAVDGGEGQREMAIRFGVNLVMHVITGSYKADQVHVPALLERLNQERRVR